MSAPIIVATPWVLTRAINRAGLDAWLAAGPAAGAMTGGKIALYKTAHVPLPDDTLASYTLADFTGYAPSAGLTWAASEQDENGHAQAVAQLLTFAATGTAVPNDVYGALLLNPAMDTLWAAHQFVDGPFPMAGTADAIFLLPVFKIPPAA